MTDGDGDGNTSTSIKNRRVSVLSSTPESNPDGLTAKYLAFMDTEAPQRP